MKHWECIVVCTLTGEPRAQGSRVIVRAQLKKKTVDLKPMEPDREAKFLESRN